MLYLLAIMLLQPSQRTKLDNTEDDLFYDYPRFVTHVDEAFIQQLTDLYCDRLASLQASAVSRSVEALRSELRVKTHGRDLCRTENRLQPNTRIFDMMSSWVSHLPNQIKFAHVEGHGLNAEELARNPRLDHYFVQDLNQNQIFPLPDQSFDAVLNTVSIQYLQYPEAIFAEIYRILKPGGIVIISFSNRMFFQKAIQAWREGSEADRVDLVKHYFESVPGFSTLEVIARQLSAPAGLLQWLNLGAGDPFYAVIACRLPE